MTVVSAVKVRVATSGRTLIQIKHSRTGLVNCSSPGIVLHAVDATGLVHALLLRIQALLLPVKTLVLSGH